MKSLSAMLRKTQQSGHNPSGVMMKSLSAFEVLVRRYDRLVFAIIAKHVARDQVADIAQDVFIRGYESLPHYRLNTSFPKWLVTIAVRRCCDYWRAEKRHPTYAISSLSVEDTERMEQLLLEKASDAAHSDMERDRMREELGRAMEGLETDVQAILWLLYWNDCSLAETAEILGYSPGSVRVHASRARALLRRRMESAAIAEHQSMPANGYSADGMIAVS